MSCQPLLLRLVFVYSDGIFTPRAPMPLHISAHLVRLIGRVPVEAAVRTLRVVEQDSTFNRFGHLLQAGKRQSVKEFVLDSIVDAFGHCIVFRVAALGHAWRNVVQPQLFYVLRAGVLGTAVGVVDEGVGKAFGQRGHGFLQSYSVRLTQIGSSSWRFYCLFSHLC